MKAKASINTMPEIIPCVREYPRKGFREFYILEDTWGAGIFFLTGINQEQYHAWTKEKFNTVTDSKHWSDNAFHDQCSYAGSNYQVVVLQEKWTWSRIQWVTLVHELGHAAFAILRNKGIKINEATEECFTYLQDSLLNRLIWALGAKNRKKILVHAPRRPKKRPLAKKRAKK